VPAGVYILQLCTVFHIEPLRDMFNIRGKRGHVGRHRRRASSHRVVGVTTNTLRGIEVLGASANNAVHIAVADAGGHLYETGVN
jgi:hypothetical protein